MTELQLLTSEEKYWLSCFKSSDYGQSHLFENISCEETKSLISQLLSVEKTYPGGLLNYLNRARRLLVESSRNINPFENCVPEVPLSVNLTCGSSEFYEYENIGLNELDGIVFVLVAGGLGERLECPNIKLALPVESISCITYLEYYIKMILMCEELVEKTQNIRPKIPLCIMTSDDTHMLTLKMLEENGFFGFPRDQVSFIKQERVPALIDNEARIAVKSKSVIEMKPHGHGDVHSLLFRHGLPEKWEKQGKRWVLFFQDTNALVCNAILPLLGVSKKMDLTMNSLTVPRKPGEALGAVCKLVRPNEPPLTINVEYNVLGSLLENGDLVEANGYSKFPGNTNILLFRLNSYASVLKNTKGCVPEFINPKYTDSSRTIYKSPARLECMMQELPRYFTEQEKVGITQLDRWLCFSAVKNGVKSAIEKIKNNIAPECAFSAEADFYFANAKLLEIAAKEKCENCFIAPPELECYAGVKYNIGPRIVLTPSFGMGLTQIRNRIKHGNIEISAKSSLILDGEININSLKLSGGLIVRNKSKNALNIKNLSIANGGHKFLPTDHNADPKFLIRGYKVQASDVAEISM